MSDAVRRAAEEITREYICGAGESRWNRVCREIEERLQRYFDEETAALREELEEARQDQLWRVRVAIDLGDQVKQLREQVRELEAELISRAALADKLIGDLRQQGALGADDIVRLNAEIARLREALEELLAAEWCVTADWSREKWEKATDTARRALAGGEVK